LNEKKTLKQLSNEPFSLTCLVSIDIFRIRPAARKIILSLRSKRQRCDAFWRRTQEGGLGRTREFFTEIKTYRTNRCPKTDSSIPNATVRRATHSIPLRVAAKRGGASTVNKLRDELLRKKNSLNQSLVVREHTGSCFADDSRECALSTGAEEFLVCVDDLIAPENTAMDQSPFFCLRIVRHNFKPKMRVMWPQPHRNIPRKSSSLLLFLLLPLLRWKCAMRNPGLKE
ncbi:hypothetical protein TCSYLVIO_010989, partial [Trypanosoma cruzi]